MKTLLRKALALGIALGLMGMPGSSFGADAPPDAMASTAINALGIELLSKASEPGQSVLLSPYSVQMALAMTYAGAEGKTREEMARVLHYEGVADEELHRAFGSLQRDLQEVANRTAETAARARQSGRQSDPFTLTVANRLYGQEGYDFRKPFLSLTAETYDAPFQTVDFVKESGKARIEINQWVEQQTRERIRDLIPADGVSSDTRLVLVNAIYMKAPWSEPFEPNATRPEPFYKSDGTSKNVPTMNRTGRFGYEESDEFSTLVIPYSGGSIQFVAFIPKTHDGLPALEKRITPGILLNAAKIPSKELILHLPKFKMEPPLFRLGESLRALGMKTAFDVPKGSANFDKMAPRKPDDYLCISEVFHKTFLDLDEKGTEAAAATAVSMMRATSIQPEKPKPIEVKVDRPFLFAIQHRGSGACLFIGRLLEP